ncbi:P2X purinoceptor 7 isoform X1 [Oryzias melastigma]|uniref:P2X purinoceptor 7 isoform X1 n=1 Tax=Oryzias melastigma TaxID=30732 RepID=UPI000CF7E118|nr:P2X purinoceptor 7 isoform X1 [Oryzias melastigma]
MASTDSEAESNATISISDFSSDEQKDEEESCGDDESLVQPYRFEPFCESEEDVAESSSDADDDSQHEDSARLQNTAWCQCQCCAVMPLAVECICCHEIEEVQGEMLRSGVNASCITEVDSFQTCCLNPDVLRVAYYAYIDNHGRLEETTPHERYRYIAYRQFVRLCWGHLGRAVRVTLPSCAVNKIRSTFPAPTGQYVGFLYPALD